MKKFLSTLIICSLFNYAYASGKIQGADVKSEAELVSAGATKAQLIPDSKLYITANGINDRLDNAITNGQIGGTASGSVNLLNGGFENGTTGWTTYKNTAQSTPVNGTGGSPTSTLAQTTTNPIYGKGTGVMTHPASNVQGEGTSYAFSIDKGLQNSAVVLSGSYNIGSGTYSSGSSTTDSDVEVYIYDMTNSSLIEPNGYKLDKGGILGQNYDFNVSFQTASNSTSYRVIFHYPNTTASAFVFNYEIKGITVNTIAGSSPKAQLYGSIKYAKTAGCTWVSTGTSYVTPAVVSACPTPTMTGVYTSSSGKTPSITFSTLPAGTYQFVVKGPLVVNSNSTTSAAGYYRLFDGAVGYDEIYGSTTGNGGVGTNAFTSGFTQQITYTTTQSNVTLSVQIKSTSATVFDIDASTADFTIDVYSFPTVASIANDIGDQRVIAAILSGTPSNSAYTANTIIKYPTVISDTHGAYSVSSGQYTIPQPGYYRATCFQDLSAVASGNVLQVYVNGSASVNIAASIATNTDFIGSGLFTALAGQLVDFRITANATLGVGRCSIEKVQGPSQVGPQETIEASYWISANFSAVSTAPINFDSKDFDTHNAVTTGVGTWKFTAPASGTYNVTVNCSPSVTTYYTIYKNGSAYKVSGGANTTSMGGGSSLIKLLAGEYIDARTHTSSIQGGGGLGSIPTSTINIVKVGNY